MNDLDRADWFTIGLKFGFGFCLVVTAFSVAGSLLALSLFNHQMAAVIGQFERTVKPIAGPIPAPSRQVRIPQSRLVVVDPQSKEICLERSGGVVNPEFVKCTRGYSYTITE
ncbi:hypothetical protein [Nevskia sp.]|uniref:hypothetical protein n=1 Tax=Nevskia sp. TaxID=1929292 RepID=UPI0025E32CA6|nr:hypothetical protein [Nevskia sp.]